MDGANYWQQCVRGSVKMGDGCCHVERPRSPKENVAHQSVSQAFGLNLQPAGWTTPRGFVDGPARCQASNQGADPWHVQGQHLGDLGHRRAPAPGQCKDSKDVSSILTEIA